MAVTAKIKVTGKNPSTDGQTTLNFGVDYADDRNKEWAKYTPILNITMVVLDVVAERFDLGQPFVLTFSSEGE